jgi:hypothetical protein
VAAWTAKALANSAAPTTYDILIIFPCLPIDLVPLTHEHIEASVSALRQCLTTDSDRGSPSAQSALRRRNRCARRPFVHGLADAFHFAITRKDTQCSSEHVPSTTDRLDFTIAWN